MLTPDAKKLLAETIRGSAQAPEKGIRARLLQSIHDEADRRYRLSVPITEAGLDEAHRRQRERIEAWLDERTRATKPKSKAQRKATTERLLAQAEKEAAATLVNRLVLLRRLEALGLCKPAVITGGWNSKGYREFREFAPTLCTNGTSDATEGYATLLQFVFDELAVDLPGLFGDVGLTRLFQIPAATLREVIERLDDPNLGSAWTDDTTLGWVYQYWNDPDRESLDLKLDSGGKIEPHEVAPKTQMFTERYLVEWLLQNSLGLTWLAMCQKRGWTASAERALPVLEARRTDWRKRREAGEVALEANMPIETELEEHWKYYVPQPIPEDAVEKAPESVRAIKILDPACGSGHFLVIAFGLLVALYREEAKHRGNEVSDKEISESILENNLFGIDIDPRAIQIAAAALYLKAKTLSNASRPKKLNLVAPVLQLGNLPIDDPAVVLLRNDLKNQSGIPGELTTNLLTALAGVDHVGSLLKVDAAVEDAIKNVELEFERTQGQGNLFSGFPAQQVKLSLSEAKATIVNKLEQFLAKRSKSEDLGVRLDGEQLAAGVRFVRIAKEGAYDLVVSNPPYSDTSLLADPVYVRAEYPRGRANLYAAFLDRSLDLVRPGGLSAFLTMRGWLFQIDPGMRALREHTFREHDLRTLGDVGRGAFEDIPDEQVSAAMTVIRRAAPSTVRSIALQPTAPIDRSRDAARTRRKRAGLLAQVGRHDFRVIDFQSIEAWPLVYWWDGEFLTRYRAAPKLGNAARQGMATTNNPRFLRKPWEVAAARQHAVLYDSEDVRPASAISVPWVPYIKGAAGACWLEPLEDLVLWEHNGLELKVCNDHRYGSFSRNIKSESYYFKRGVAFSMIGDNFTARAHRFRSIMGHMGSSAFTASVADAVCMMNSATARHILRSLNPGVHFEVGDVNRLAILPVEGARQVFETLERSFARHESHREPSVEFKRPGCSDWSSVQAWSQRAVDRSSGSPLPPHEPEEQPPTYVAFISFAVGVSLGRFAGDGTGLLDGTPSVPVLPSGILFVAVEGPDTLEHSSSEPIRAAWTEHGSAVARGADVRTFLRTLFFADHLSQYQKRPIYFPLSSARKSFVAFVSIHRWADDTLNVLLADHLMPAKRRLDGEIGDIRTARALGHKNGKLEKRFTELQKLLEELNDFIARVIEVAEKGPRVPDSESPPRELDARYVMDLDDGVVVNSAALWTLLEPQWKDPKKWWWQLANQKGPKGVNYDWAHLAARYFPTRVQQKCHDDPSMAVAHKCFWRLHPSKAYAWELRLQDEIRPDFTIDEPDSDAARAKFIADHAPEAREILAKELKRRERKIAKADEDDEPLLNQASDESDEGVDD